jgi:hypothetical protein
VEGRRPEDADRREGIVGAYTPREAAVLNHLARPATRPRAAAPGAGPDFVFAYLEADRTYDLSEYPVAGVFGEPTAPWLNDVDLVPSYEHWTLTDVEYRAQRMAQITAQNQFASANVPGQRYTGDPAEQIRQRFSRGLFDPTLFAPADLETLTRHWLHDDAEFGRRPLGGANPAIVALYRGSAEALARLLETGGAHDPGALARRLEAARANRQLFWCDYAALLGPVLDRGFVRTGQHWSVPTVFYVYDDAARGLMPAAVRLTPGAYWFTPADDANAWLLAKLHAASADVQSWFSGTHLFHTHSVAMIFGIALLRLIAQGTLSVAHPMALLVNPHLAKVYDVNTKVYDMRADPTRPFDPVTNPLGVYQKGQFCDQHLPTGRIGVYQIASSHYANYRFADQAFDRSITARGLDSKTLPGFFPYRDDGLVWWKILQAFTAAVVGATYASDGAVADDRPLGEWMHLVERTFNRDGVTRFTWMPTRDALASTLTHVAFLTTAQHTAINNAMFDAQAFLPNALFAMTGPPPSGPGVGDRQLLGALPDPQNPAELQGAILAQVDFMMVGTPVVTDRAAARLDRSALHDMFPYDPTTQSGQYEAVSELHAQLLRAKGVIEDNQRARIDHYRRRHPGAATVPNSVSYRYLSVERVMACIQS